MSVIDLGISNVGFPPAEHVWPSAPASSELRPADTPQQLGPPRGPDTVVELSPQATDESSATPGANGSADTNPDTQGHRDPPLNPEDAAGRSNGGKPLTDDQQKQVAELKKRDQEVRRHEQAHKAAAGPLARGGPTFQFQTGPDGKQYAVGGEVQIDTSPVEGDPEATIAKMQAVRRAATAPADPSAQDRAVAAQAARTAQNARQELHQHHTGGPPDATDAPSHFRETSSEEDGHRSTTPALTGQQLDTHA